MPAHLGRMNIGTGLWQYSHRPKVRSCGRGGASFTAQMRVFVYNAGKDYTAQALAYARPVSGQACLPALPGYAGQPFRYSYQIATARTLHSHELNCVEAANCRASWWSCDTRPTYIRV